MLYPPDDKRRNAEPAPGCPGFGEESVVDRGPDGHPPAIGSVRPGLHRPTPDGPSVVWWDPAALALEVEENVALRHQRILEVDDGVTAAASEQNYAACVNAGPKLHRWARVKMHHGCQRIGLSG
jgi:hypothetical protein